MPNQAISQAPPLRQVRRTALTFLTQLLAAFALACWCLQAAAQGYCFVIYDSNEQVIYRDSTAPVSMMGTISEGLVQLGLRRAHMVFFPYEGSLCGPPVDRIQVSINATELADASPRLAKLPSSQTRLPLKDQGFQDVREKDHAVILDRLADRHAVGPVYGGGSYTRSRVVHVGPRGGVFTYSSTGRKVYQSRGKR